MGSFMGNNELLKQSLQRHIVALTWGRIQRLQVEVADDRVTVHGQSPSYYLKQRVLQAVREIVDDAPVDLDIDVATELHQERFRQQPLPVNQ